MEPNDEELFQRFQRGVKRIMRYYNHDPEDQGYAYAIYETIFYNEKPFSPAVARVYEKGLRFQKLTSKQKQEILDSTSGNLENDRVFTFFKTNFFAEPKLYPHQELSGSPLQTQLLTVMNNPKGWWLFTSKTRDELYILHIFPYSIYDYPERLKDTNLYENYDGYSFYYATIYPKQRGSVSFSSEQGFKPFPWSESKGWSGVVNAYYLGQTVKEITRPRTHGLLNWWGELNG